MTAILVTNTSALLTPADIAPVIAAINKQIIGDFAPLWGAPGTLYYGDAPAGAWKFSLQDDIDQAGDLGYHVDDAGLVSAIIDVKACSASGDDWRTCLGHEVLEALADPLCTRMGAGAFANFMCEVADPVEEDSYDIDGVPVTNFVTPSYFGFDAGTTYDKNGWLSGPAPALRPAGYIMAYDPATNAWSSTFGERAEGYMATRINGRRAWRKRKV